MQSNIALTLKKGGIAEKSILRNYPLWILPRKFAESTEPR
jgi:hypothetical protein